MELHDSVNHFVFPCINRPVPRESPYNLSLVEDGDMHWTPSKQKLIADLHSKQNFVIHHSLLRGILANGFNVIKILRAFEFDQKFYMKTSVNDLRQK